MKQERQVHAREIHVRRLSVVSGKPFDQVVDSLSQSVGHPPLEAFHGALMSAASQAELEAVVNAAVGPSTLLEFARYDTGAVLRKKHGGPLPRSVRLVIGNPVVMSEMARRVPDAAAYAPLTILVDERADGVHLSYDSMASLLAPYGDAQALAVAAQLDEKVESLLEMAAG